MESNPTPPATIDNLDADLDAVSDEPTFEAAKSALTPKESRRELIVSAKRRLTPVRRTAVQLPRGTDDRTGPLLRLVKGGQHLAFDLELLYLALQPVTTDGDLLTNAEWANLMSAGGRTREAPAISRAWRVLETEGLISRSSGKAMLCREDGLGGDWTHPGDDRDPTGYFHIPRSYWIRNFADELSLTGKGMLLILLGETNNPGAPPLSFTHKQFSDYYGLSESSVKRGLQDLRQHGVLGERWERRPAKRSKTGDTQVGFYWLKNPFSTASRERARQLDVEEIESQAAQQETPDG